MKNGQHERKVLPVSEEWTLFTNKQQVESHSTSDNGGPQMMPGRDRDPSTWRTGLIATSNK